MLKIILDPGIVPYEELNYAIQEFSKKNSLTILTEKSRVKYWMKSGLNIANYDQLETKIHSNENVLDYDLYDRALREVLSDHRTFLLAERVNRIYFWKSVFKLVENIEILVHNSIILLKEISPDQLLFQATPHNINTWIVAKVAEVMGIEVNMIQTTALQWSFWMVKGLDSQIPFFPKSNKNTFDGSMSVQLEKYWKRNSANYNEAVPSYEKERLKKRGGNYWSWKKEISNCINNPKNFLFIRYKRNLYNTYKSLTKTPNLQENYVVFFFHFQPERTSMPEAGLFSNHWLMIRMISETLPKGWKLLIKEHPSTFTGYFDMRYRNNKFYRNISKLHNAELVGLEYNTFNLIDNSRAVVSATGTPGIQAVMRGKPAIIYGSAPYKRCEGVHYVESSQDLINTFSLIKDFNSTHLKDKLKIDLSNIELDSVSGLIDKDGDEDIYGDEVRNRGNGRLFSQYLNSFIK